MKYRFVLLLLLILPVVLSCNKNKPENWKTIKELHKKYRDGMISECEYNGATVYAAGHNAYDAGSVIYDSKGKLIASCNYAWGSVDQMCGELENCEVIYCVEDNIWGYPAVDKYELE